MDALLASLIAAVFAEFGDKTQLLVIVLAVRYRKPAPILAGVAIAALLNSLIAAAVGVVVHDMITLRAISLLVALSLLFAGVAGLIRNKRPEMGSTWKTGAFVTTATCFFLLEFGDKTQFITGAVAAQFDSLLLASLGATAGVFVANAPAAFLGHRLEKVIPLKRVRIGISIFFLLSAFVVAINALRLI